MLSYDGHHEVYGPRYDRDELYIIDFALATANVTVGICMHRKINGHSSRFSPIYAVLGKQHHCGHWWLSADLTPRHLWQECCFVFPVYLGDPHDKGLEKKLYLFYVSTCFSAYKIDRHARYISLTKVPRLYIVCMCLFSLCILRSPYFCAGKYDRYPITVKYRYDAKCLSV